jgi:hypothetical protein
MEEVYGDKTPPSEYIMLRVPLADLSVSFFEILATGVVPNECFLN